MYHMTCIKGNLTGDPGLRFTPSGTAVTNLRVAHNSYRRNEAGEWETASTLFVDVRVWDRQAEPVAEQLHKGDAVLVVLAGKAPDVNAYISKDGEARASLVYTASHVAKLVMPPKQNGDSGNGNGGAPAAAGSGGFDDEPPF